MWWAYALPLCVVTSVAMLGNGQMIRTALAILLNWAIGTLFVMATDIYDPWWLFMGLDAAAAFVILYPPAGKIQALIGCTYITQILVHFIYSVSNHAIAAYSYWEVLTGVAFVQLLLLGGWVGGHWGRRYFGHSRRSHGALAHGKKGVG